MATLALRKSVFSEFRKYCFDNGLDLFTPFAVRNYNAAVPEPYQVHTFDRPEKNCVGLLIGNSSYAWPHFIASISTNEGFLAVRDPFDTWMTQIITAAVSRARTDLVDVDIELRFAYDTTPGRIMALQRLCNSIGFGHYNLEQGLVVHPVLGPWFALRAVVLIDLPADDPVFDAPIAFAPAEDLDLSLVTSLDRLYRPPSRQAPIAASPCTAAGCGALHTPAMAIALGSDVAASQKQTAAALESFRAQTDADAEAAAVASARARARASGMSVSATAPGCLFAPDPKERPSFDASLWSPARRELRFLPSRLDCRVGAPGVSYPPGMVLYHYTHDRAVLVEEVRAQRVARHNRHRELHSAAAAAAAAADVAQGAGGRGGAMNALHGYGDEGDEEEEDDDNLLGYAHHNPQFPPRPHGHQRHAHAHAHADADAAADAAAARAIAHAHAHAHGGGHTGVDDSEHCDSCEEPDADGVYHSQHAAHLPHAATELDVPLE